MFFVEFSFEDIVSYGILLSYIFAAVLAIFSIMKAGITFILSSGDEDKVKEGFHTIRYAVLGLLWIIISWVFIRFLGSLFGFNFFSFLTLEKFQMVYDNIMGILSNTQPEDSLKGILD